MSPLGGFHYLETFRAHFALHAGMKFSRCLVLTLNYISGAKAGKRKLRDFKLYQYPRRSRLDLPPTQMLNFRGRRRGGTGYTREP
jgi:hypothetical protein